MGNGFVLKALTESFAVSTHSAVNEIEPQRARSTRRVRRNKVSMETNTVPLRSLRALRLIKNKTAENAKDAERK